MNGAKNSKATTRTITPIPSGEETKFGLPPAGSLMFPARVTVVEELVVLFVPETSRLLLDVLFEEDVVG